MEKLANEDIQFIDNYLKNSGVEFLDVRVEMVDHVASDIEQKIKDGDQRGFYSIFKDYMIENKKSILDNNKRYYKKADKKIMRLFKLKVFSANGILVFAFILTIVKLLNVQQLVFMMDYGGLIIVLSVAIFYFALLGWGKQRYSSLERVGIYFFVMSQILNVCFNAHVFLAKNPFLLELSFIIISFYFAIFIQIAVYLKKEYKLKYNTV